MARPVLTGIDNSNGFFPEDAEMPGWDQKAYKKAHEKKTNWRPWAIAATVGALSVGALVMAGGNDNNETSPTTDSSVNAGTTLPIVDIVTAPPQSDEGIPPVGSTLAPIVHNTVVVTAAP